MAKSFAEPFHSRAPRAHSSEVSCGLRKPIHPCEKPLWDPEQTYAPCGYCTHARTVASAKNEDDKSTDKPRMLLNSTPSAALSRALLA